MEEENKTYIQEIEEIDEMQLNNLINKTVKEKKINWIVEIWQTKEEFEIIYAGKEINFFNCEFVDDIIIKNWNYDLILFTDCYIKSIKLGERIYVKNFQIRNSKWLTNLQLDGSPKIDFLNLFWWKFDLDIYWWDIKKIDIRSDLPYLGLRDTHITWWGIWSNNINFLIMQGNIDWNFNISSEIINFWEWYNINNKWNLSFSETKFNNINIYYSNLWSWLFSSCQFPKYGFNINDCIIKDIQSVNNNWDIFVRSELNSPWDERENYRQLKYAMEQQKDHINALKFYSKEMNAYFRDVMNDILHIFWYLWKWFFNDLKYDLTHKFDCWFKINFKNIRNEIIPIQKFFWALWNWVLLLFSLLTNNFWRRWLQALIVYVIVQLAFFNWFSGTFETFMFDLFNRTDQTTLYLTQFLNPTSGIEDFGDIKSDLRWLASLILYFGKIRTAVMLYQIIIAFRKYVRKL